VCSLFFAFNFANIDFHSFLKMNASLRTFAFLAMFGSYASAVWVVEMNTYQNDNCSGTPETSPFVTAGQCTRTSSGAFAIFDCDANTVTYSNNSRCSGGTTVSLDTCIAPNATEYEYESGFEYEGSGNQTSNKFTCVQQPTEKVLVMNVGTGCENGQVSGFVLQIAQISDSCQQFPQLFGSQVSSYHVVVNGNNVTSQIFNKDNCNGEPDFVQNSQLDQCAALSGSIPGLGGNDLFVSFSQIEAGGGGSSSATTSAVSFTALVVAIVATFMVAM